MAHGANVLQALNALEITTLDWRQRRLHRSGKDPRLGLFAHDHAAFVLGESVFFTSRI